MVIVFDLDDTLCDTDEYSEKYILEFITEHNLPYRRLTKAVRYAEMKFDWDKETANRWYIKFGDQMMAQFPPKPYAVDLIRALREAGNKVVISTARNIDWHTDPENVTKKWLYEKGFEYDKLY